MNKWGELAYEIKRKEPHSLPNVHVSLYRNQLYVIDVNEMGLHWLGLGFHFPLLSFAIPNWRSDTYLGNMRVKRRWQSITTLKGLP